GRLDALERLIGHRADEIGQIGAANALAVLAPENAAMRVAQGIDRVGDGGESGAVERIVEVQCRPDMQAPHVDMAVNAVIEAMPLHDGVEAVDEGDEVLDRDHAILDEGDGAALAVALAEEANGGGANTPKALPLGGIGCD